MTTHTTTGDVATIPDEPAPEARILEHAYDGIHEYDNPLPGWWSAIFWATIVFAAAYGIFYHVGHWGSTPESTYAVALDKTSLRETWSSGCPLRACTPTGTRWLVSCSSKWRAIGLKAGYPNWRHPFRTNS